MKAVDFARRNISYLATQDCPREFNRINYIMRGDGLWEIRKNKIATFTTRKCSAELIGFSGETYEEGFELHLPKIPLAILDQIVTFFTHLSKGRYEYEAYVQIFWNSDRGEYYVHCPRQEVSKTRVRYEFSVDIPTNHIFVAEIHSHNTMGAYFSPVDDRDELVRGDRFFGVIGRLDLAEPEIQMSFVSGGKRFNIPWALLFEVKETIPFPSEWLKQIYFGESNGHEEESSEDID